MIGHENQGLFIRLRWASAILAVTLLVANSRAAAQEKVLHSFSDNGKDGQSPVGGLIFDSAGNLYGTSLYGGTYDDGGTKSSLHSPIIRFAIA